MEVKFRCTEAYRGCPEIAEAMRKPSGNPEPYIQCTIVHLRSEATASLRSVTFCSSARAAASWECFSKNHELHVEVAQRAQEGRPRRPSSNRALPSFAVATAAPSQEHATWTRCPVIENTFEGV